ncbi:unnamed protein product [Lactuca saligna]|uniref:Uncharacterized protein n=1 Tax=Lactuca saligna TaxID=75948 RepID=A0AA36EP85_LACSI|nr:unnamed protein product [Lactuca saligna]
MEGKKTFGRYDRIEISDIIFAKINGALNEAQLRYKAFVATLCSVLSAILNSKHSHIDRQGSHDLRSERPVPKRGSFSFQSAAESLSDTGTLRSRLVFNSVMEP